MRLDFENLWQESNWRLKILKLLFLAKGAEI